MEPRTLTTISQLKPGDRFYRAKDKHKKVFQLIDHEPHRTSWRTYKFWCMPADIIDRPVTSKDAYAQAINKDSEVVFLRHNATNS